MAIRFTDLEMTGTEEDILAIREVWQRYASPLFVDLLDTEPALTRPGERLPPFADLDTIRMDRPKIEDPKKRLEEILRRPDES